MTTLNLRLPQLHLHAAGKQHRKQPEIQAVLNFIAEVGQVVTGALRIIPAPPAGLNPHLRRDLGL